MPKLLDMESVTPRAEHIGALEHEFPVMARGVEEMVWPCSAQELKSEL